MKNILFLALFITALQSCEEPIERADAYGNFEATETLVSAEATGKLLAFTVEEGAMLEAGQRIGVIDTTQLHLKKMQLQASIGTVGNKKQNTDAQVEVLQEQKRNLIRERDRVKALLQDKAATPKQLDDINGQIEVVDKQIFATQDQTVTVNKGILGEIAPIKAQIKQIEDQLSRSYLYNPIKGTVMSKLAEPYEMVMMGSPLYKIANLEELSLRAYVIGSQLPHLKIGQKVTVLIDDTAETNRSLEGTISWISDKAEFTPKIVQTKEERVNLVYAIKVKVKNDGSLKIGMPAEVNF